MDIVLPVLLGICILILIIVIVRILFKPKYVKHIQEFYKQGKYSQASRIAKQVITKDPQNASGHYFLGLCYEIEEKPELALMELKTVNRIGQFNEYINEISFRKKIADLYLRFNQIEEALKEYLLLVQTDEENPEFYYLIGTLFEKRDKSDTALTYYKKAINIDPRHADSYARLGSIMYRGNRFRDARIYLDKATKLDPGNTFGSFNLGKILKDEKDYPGALIAFEAASKDPELKSKSITERGVCFLKMKNFERAESELLRAIKFANDSRAPETLYARYSLASLFETTRKIDNAIEQWEEIFKVNDKFRDVAQKLTDYQGLRTDDAMKDFLTVGEVEFIEICKRITASMDLLIIQISAIANGCQIVATEDSGKKWQSNRSQPCLISFMRVTSPIVEEDIRAFNDRMKDMNCSRGILLTSSTFSQMAHVFAENRSIELFDKDRLQKILKSVV